MSRILRMELYAAIAAVGLALIAGIYLAISTFAAHEACYGMVAGKLTCQTLVPGTLEYAQAAGRAAIVLSTVLFLYAVGTLAAWWQTRTKDPAARTTAYMLLVTCTLTDIAITMPAIGGVGFYFVPSAILAVVCCALGLVALLQARRAPNPSSIPASTTPQPSASRSE